MVGIFHTHKESTPCNLLGFEHGIAATPELLGDCSHSANETSQPGHFKTFEEQVNTFLSNFFS